MSLSDVLPRLGERPLPQGLLPVLLALVFVLGFAALIPDDAPLTQLELRGEFAHLNPGDVRAAAEPFLDSSFFGADVAAMRDAVAALPWVASVRAERRWPGAISLRVVERKPYARWNQDALLDTEAQAYTPRAAEIPTGLPRLGGSVGHEAEVAGTWQRVSPALADSALELLELQLDARGEWSATTVKGIELRFGQSPPDEKLPMLIDAVRKTIGDRWEQVKVVDLRYTNGFAVGWREAENSGDAK